VANKDFRLSIGFLDHPKTIKIQRQLGADGVLALLRLWNFAAQYKTDGILTGMDAEDIEIACKWNGIQGVLLSVFIQYKFVDEKIDENGEKIYILHDWEDHQGFIIHAKERSEQAKKAIATRWQNLHSKGNDTDSNTGRNTGGKQSVILKNTKRNTPSPIPSPIPSPKKKETITEEQWLENLKTSPAYDHIDFKIELAKMDQWLLLPKNKRRKKTRTFILNWLNKIEKPLKTESRPYAPPIPEEPVYYEHEKYDPAKVEKDIEEKFTEKR